MSVSGRLLSAVAPIADKFGRGQFVRNVPPADIDPPARGWPRELKAAVKPASALHLARELSSQERLAYWLAA